MISRAFLWLRDNRASVRAAFAMRIGAMGISLILGLVFPPMLVRAMGDNLYGLYQSFLDITRLGGLSDLGMGGSVALKAGQYLGKGEGEKLRELLASARSVFILLALLGFAGFFILSPWLPRWLTFDRISGTGSLRLLIIFGGLNVAFVILAGYFHSLNFALGTVTWPIVPGLLISQLLAPLAHVWLAIHQAPLWLQFTPYALATGLSGILAWLMVKWAHPWLGNLRPLGFNRTLWKLLAGTSGWFYLATLGNAIYFATDRPIIYAGFGGFAVNRYRFNYKLGELATTMILTASFVSIPKITQWVASGRPEDRQRVILEANRLNIVQIILGCGAALGYLAINDWFVAWWQGAKYQAPLALQIAFAMNLAVTAGGDAGIQMAARCGENGIRNMGIAVGATGLLNLALSFLSMRLGYIVGIAAATVLAQAILSLSLGWLTCRHLKMPVLGWSLKSCLVPVMVVGLGGLIRMGWPLDSLMHGFLLIASYAAILAVAMRVSGLNREMVAKEWKVLTNMVGR